MTDTAQSDGALILAQSETDRLTREREEIAQELAELKAAIQALRQALKAGEARKPGEDGKLLKDAQYWMRALRETEAELNDLRRKQSGIAGEYGLDLDAARDQIGCRLGRLAACCGAGEVPG